MNTIEEKNLHGERFYKIGFWIILFFSVIFRLPFLGAERMWPDEALYAWAAKRIFLHPELIFSKEIMDFHPPLFSILLSIGHFFFSPLMACHLSVFLINILGIVLIYFLGIKIQGRFLGCFAAMVLSFNLEYFKVSNFILIDGVVSVFTILFFYVLTGVDHRRITRQDFLLGFMVMALILLKWSGGLVLPFIFIYYLLAFPELTFCNRILRSFIPLMFGAFLVGILLWHNHEILGTWIPKVFGQANDYYRESFYYYYDYSTDYIFIVQLMPFLIFGLWLSLKSRDRDFWVQGFWVVFAFLMISAMPSKDFRDRKSTRLNSSH